MQMHMQMYVYVYACSHAFVCINLYVHMCTCIHVCTINVFGHMYMCIHICDVRACIYIYISIHICVYRHLHTHIHINNKYISTCSKEGVFVDILFGIFRVCHSILQYLGFLQDCCLKSAARWLGPRMTAQGLRTTCRPTKGDRLTG